MTSTLDFVDSIAASPTVRLNLADGTTWSLVRDGTDFAPPQFKRVIASTMLRDGATVPSSAYDLRRIILDLALTGATADDTATALQNLYRQLDRARGNILRWRDGTTHPVFFKTFRASAAAVDVRPGSSDGRKKRILVELLAEPFALGLRENPVSAVTVNGNPAAGSNGCFVDVTGLKGDVETPALIKWPTTSAGNESLFAVRRRGTPSATPFLFQAEAMTQSLDTTTQTNDAGFSGSGNNYSRTTFATLATMQTRLLISDLGAPSIDLRGTYRVFLRYRKNTGSDAMRIQLVWGGPAVSLTNDAFDTPDTNQLCMADLGLITIPRGADPVEDFQSGVQLPVDDFYELDVQAERTAGSSTLDFDYMLLVPADDRLAFVKWFDTQAEDHWWLDAHDDSGHARTAGNEVATVAAPGVAGGMPMLSPNVTNRIFVVYEVAAGQGHLIGGSAADPAVSVSYFPRYLSVRPAST